MPERVELPQSIHNTNSSNGDLEEQEVKAEVKEEHAEPAKKPQAYINSPMRKANTANFKMLKPQT